MDLLFCRKKSPIPSAIRDRVYGVAECSPDIRSSIYFSDFEIIAKFFAYIFSGEKSIYAT